MRQGLSLIDTTEIDKLPVVLRFEKKRKKEEGVLFIVQTV